MPDNTQDVFQVSVNVTLVDRDKDGNPTGKQYRCTREAALLALKSFVERELASKTFSSGRVGFYAGGKMRV